MKYDKLFRKLLDEEEQHLIDDYPFQIASDKFPSFTGFIIKKITGEDVDIKEVRTAVKLKNPQGKEIIADVILYAENGTVYNLGANRYRSGSVLERGLFHAFIIGSILLSPGEEWGSLRKGIIIMLNLHDAEKSGCSVRTYIITEKSTKENAFSDKGIEIHMVNCLNIKQKELEDLFHDLTADFTKEKMRLPIMKKVVEYLMGKEGRKAMTKKWEEYIKMERDDAAKEAAEATTKEVIYNTAKAMLKDGLPEERVSRILNLSGNEISSISGTMR